MGGCQSAPSDNISHSSSKHTNLNNNGSNNNTRESGGGGRGATAATTGGGGGSSGDTNGVDSTNTTHTAQQQQQQQLPQQPQPQQLLNLRGGRRNLPPPPPPNPFLSITGTEINNHKNNDSAQQQQQHQHDVIENIILPNDPQFHVSINGRNGLLVSDVYELGDSCGKGAFGDVYIATHKRQPTKKYAIKKTAPTVLDRRGGVRIWTYDNVEEKCSEIKSLIRLREDGNPYYSCVLFLYEYYWTFNHSNGKGTLHMVTELLGQELEVWRQGQPTLLESTVKHIAGILLNALDYISSRNVIHRDIKLQNILFRVTGDIKTLKLVDFGLAKILEGNDRASDFCGSLGYISPEIYEGKPYRYEVDMFAFGVILFRLLCGVRPFSANNPEKLRSDTVNLRYNIEGRNWEGVSPNALKLVRNLLIGPQQRYTAEQAINHEWFTEQSTTDSILKPDFTMTQSMSPNIDDNDDNNNNNEHPHPGVKRRGDNYSQAIALSQVPEELLRNQNRNKFFLDIAVEKAVKLLIRKHKYIGKIVPADSNNNTNATSNSNRNTNNVDGLICVEEIAPKTLIGIPKYIVHHLPSYTEKDCRVIFHQIVSIIKLCHDNGLAHRNILFTSLLVDPRCDERNNIILQGLHYAQAVAVDQPLTGHFGYLYSWYAFKAPEIDSELFHDKTVDNWSLGATLYMLLTALPPFREDGVELIKNKHRGNVVFDTILSSPASQQLVRGLLQPNPKKRMTIEQVFQSEWMTMDDAELAKYDLSLTQQLLWDF